MEKEEKEETYHCFYQAFHGWFMSEENGCAFWSECNAPEALAMLAVEIADRMVQEALDYERLMNMDC